MIRIQKIVLGFIIAAIGVVYLLKSTGVYALNHVVYYYYLLQFIGVFFVFTSIGNNKRAVLFLGAVLFMTGLIFFLQDQYEILNPIKIILPSVLITFGSGFFLLFIDNKKEKAFLVLSVILFAVGLLVIKMTGIYTSLDTANRMIFRMFEFWPVLLSLIGIGLLANSKRN